LNIENPIITQMERFGYLIDDVFLPDYMEETAEEFVFVDELAQCAECGDREHAPGEDLCSRCLDK
jgi:hypothetical protein